MNFLLTKNPSLKKKKKKYIYIYIYIFSSFFSFFRGGGTRASDFF